MLQAPYRPYLREQFSIAYDLYLDLRRRTEKKMLHSLGRDSFAWRLKHACPSCMYKLEGEEELTFCQLFCVDGNNSMKRVFLREKIVSDGDTGDGAEFVLGESKEREDSRDAGENLYLPREKVNEFAKHRLAELFPPEATEPEV
jgi:hypothetical protein